MTTPDPVFDPATDSDAPVEDTTTPVVGPDPTPTEDPAPAEDTTPTEDPAPAPVEDTTPDIPAAPDVDTPAPDVDVAPAAPDTPDAGARSQDPAFYNEPEPPAQPVPGVPTPGAVSDNDPANVEPSREGVAVDNSAEQKNAGVEHDVADEDLEAQE